MYIHVITDYQPYEDIYIVSLFQLVRVEDKLLWQYVKDASWAKHGTPPDEIPSLPRLPVFGDPFRGKERIIGSRSYPFSFAFDKEEYERALEKFGE